MIIKQERNLKNEKPKKTIKLRYLNYKGEIAWRHVLPIRIRFGNSKWHGESLWLLKAFDLDRNAEREFALKDIQDWDFGTSG